MSIDADTFSPVVVCLCGSTRFKKEFEAANERETLAGKIVLSVGFFNRTENAAKPDCDEAAKTKLDELHLRKIDLADEVLILDVAGYVGASTKREAWYALHRGKILRWLEPLQIVGADYPNPQIIDGPDLIEHVESWFEDWDAWRAAGAVAAR